MQKHEEDFIATMKSISSPVYINGTSREVERTNAQAKRQLDIQCRMRGENLHAKFDLIKKSQQLYRTQKTSFDWV